MIKKKMKTHKGFFKRFFITGHSKIKFFSSGKKHNLRTKNRKHNRHLKKHKYLKKSSRNIIKHMIACI